MAIVVNTTLTIKSPAFLNNDFIPLNYSCEGSNINPAISIQDLPKETVSLALIMDDPDARSGTFVHWIMWNIPPTKMIGENTAPGIQGINSADENKYHGPCPPSGTHRYFFKLYALDTLLNLPEGIKKQDLEKAMQGHILAQTQIIGLYKKTF